MKTKTKSYYKRKAWDAFSKFIRYSYANAESEAECYTCSKVFPVNKLQAGHGISGRNNSVLFMEEIVKPQCVGCNIYGRGKQAVFTRKLIEELGMGAYDHIVKESTKIVQYKAVDYEEIQKLYEDKLKQL